MDKPHGVPDDIWATALACTPDNFKLIIASAILEERVRCARIADREMENTDILVSHPPKSSAAWKIRDAILSGS